VNYVDETLAALKKHREQHDAVVVSYSGGKDSLCVMEMCTRTFPKVEAFIMEFVPGLSGVDRICEFAKAKWGITVRRYLHWAAAQAMADGSYCDLHWKKNISKITLAHVYRQVRAETGIELIAVGAKRADPVWRKRALKLNMGKMGAVINPIEGWQKMHVLAYLKSRGLPVGVGVLRADNASNGTSGTCDLTVNSILWLHDTQPDDYKKLVAVFPYCEAVVWRRTFYGIGKTYTKESKPDGT